MFCDVLCVCGCVLLVVYCVLCVCGPRLTAHCPLAVAVEVRDCPLRSGGCCKLKSETAHCDLALAVEIRAWSGAE